MKLIQLKTEPQSTEKKRPNPRKKQIAPSIETSIYKKNELGNQTQGATLYKRIFTTEIQSSILLDELMISNEPFPYSITATGRTPNTTNHSFINLKSALRENFYYSFTMDELFLMFIFDNNDTLLTVLKFNDYDLFNSFCDSSYHIALMHQLKHNNTT